MEASNVVPLINVKKRAETDRPRRETLETTNVIAPHPATVKKMNLKRAKAYKELSDRIDRSEQLGKIAAAMQTQKNLLGKGKRVKTGEKSGEKHDATKPVQYRWRKERKR